MPKPRILRRVVFAALLVGRLASADSPQRVARPEGLEFLSIPAGTFHMGCEPQDKRCHRDETPGRTATVRAFHLMKTEVTVDAYAKCVKAGVCSEPSEGGNCNWRAADRGQHPVNCVDWEQAKAFCRWVGGRLPTGEEWEFAAKGGESRIYPWGDDLPDDTRARFGPANGTDPVSIHPAGASRHGLQDMAGNVGEWTATAVDATYVLVRGGSWLDGVTGLRASFRYGRKTDTRDFVVGFRCAR